MKRILTLLLFLMLLASFPTVVDASEIDSYTANYHAEYYPQVNGKTNVFLTIEIVSIRSDIVVKQFGLSFPKSFPIENLRVLSDKTITPHQNSSSSDIRFDLPSELQGKNQKITIRLEYVQRNIFKKTGKIFEFMAPTVSSKASNTFSAVLHVPTNTFEKVSLAKPKPSNILGKDIFWNDVHSEMLYALFGQSQSYKMHLEYHLKNDLFVRQRMEVALPPETLYQKIFVEAIEPRPEEVHIDGDGNYIASFILNPRSSKDISFSGIVEVFVKPQSDFKNIAINTATKNLTEKTPYWNLGAVENADIIKNLSSAEEIYKAVISTLSYRFEKIKDRRRLGAEKALKDRENAVCTEYSDLFIAISRSKHIKSREVQGYGFSQDNLLRPLSLVSDVLHSWVEYFDTENGIWVPIDPTWEDTSKIDYFSSFDVNHIALALHGKSDTLPLPAGMYKTANTKDVLIEPISQIPVETHKLDLTTSLPKKLVKGSSYRSEVTIENKGQTFLKNKTLFIKSSSLLITPQQFTVPLLAPFEKKTFEFTTQIKSQKTGDQISFLINDEPLLKKSVVFETGESQIIITVFGVVVGMLTVLFLFSVVFKRRR